MFSFIDLGHSYSNIDPLSLFYFLIRSISYCSKLQLKCSFSLPLACIFCNLFNRLPTQLLLQQHSLPVEPISFIHPLSTHPNNIFPIKPPLLQNHFSTPTPTTTTIWTPIYPDPFLPPSVSLFYFYPLFCSTLFIQILPSF